MWTDCEQFCAWTPGSAELAQCGQGGVVLGLLVVDHLWHPLPEKLSGKAADVDLRISSACLLSEMLGYGQNIWGLLILFKSLSKSGTMKISLLSKYWWEKLCNRMCQLELGRYHNFVITGHHYGETVFWERKISNISALSPVEDLVRSLRMYCHFGAEKLNFKTASREPFCFNVVAPFSFIKALMWQWELIWLNRTMESRFGGKCNCIRIKIAHVFWAMI